MNSRKKRIAAVCLLTAALMCGTLTACGDKNGGGSTEDGTSENSGAVTGTVEKNEDGSIKPGANDTLVKVNYKVTDVQLPKDITYLDNFIWDGDNIITAYTKYDYNEETNVSTSTTNIYTIDMQGNIVKTVDITPEKLDETDNASAGNMQFMSDGTFWYSEYHSAYDQETYEELYNKTILHHIDTEGNEIFNKDVTEIPEVAKLLGEENCYLNGFMIDDKGRMTFIFNRYDEQGSKTSVVALDENGGLVFTKEYNDADGWYNGSFMGGDGKSYLMMYLNNEEGMKMNVMAVDYDNKKLSDPLPFPDNVYNVIKGDENYLAYYVDNTSLYGITYGGEKEVIFNCVENGLAVDYINCLGIHGDDLLIPFSDYSSDGGTKMYFVQKLAESEIKEKIEVKLATYYFDQNLRKVVADYNKSDGDFLITVTDYSQFNNYDTDNEEDWRAGITKFNADIAAGNIPDIISVSDEESFSSLSSKGLLMDLNLFIDGEDGLDRSEYCDNVFRGMEKNGKLYRICDSFYISAFAAKNKFIPEDGELTWETVESVLDANPEMRLFDATTVRNTFLQYAIYYDIHKYIDFDSATCSFDSPDFVKILEMSKDYPEEFDYENVDENFWSDNQMQYMEDKTLLAAVAITGYDSLGSNLGYQFGEDYKNVSLAGFPGTDAQGVIQPATAVSISAKSAHPEAGWQLIKNMISYDENSSYGDMWRFSVNKKVNEKLKQKAIDQYTNEDGTAASHTVGFSNGYGADISIEISAPTQEELDRIDRLIENTTNVLDLSNTDIQNIITEEAANFYAGKSTAQQAADAIKSRADIYLSEHQ